jgi:predicted nucleic acid-binding protein
VSWLLDTNVICEPTRSAPSPRVVEWLRSVPSSEAHASIITLGEIRRGILRLPSGQKRRKLEKWMREEFQPAFEGRLLPLGEEEITAWAELLAELEKRGRSMPAIDSLIAATALARDLTIATRNTEDFAHSGARVFNPWREG